MLRGALKRGCHTLLEKARVAAAPRYGVPYMVPAHEEVEVVEVFKGCLPAKT